MVVICSLPGGGQGGRHGHEVVALSLTSAGVLGADLLTRPGEAPGVVLGLVLLRVHRLLVVEQRLAVLEGAAAELALALPVDVVAVHVELVRRVDAVKLLLPVLLGPQPLLQNLPEKIIFERNFLIFILLTWCPPPESFLC